MEVLLTYRVVEVAFYTFEHILALADESDPVALQTYMNDYASTEAHSFVGYRRQTAVEASTDKVLQFSTCAFPSADGTRFAVIGALVGKE